MIAPPSRSPPRPSAAPGLLSAVPGVSLVDVSLAWSHTAGGVLCLASCRERPVFKVPPCRPVCRDFIPLYGCPPSAVWTPHTPSVLPAGGRLDGVDFLAVASSTAANSHAQVLTDGRFQLSGAFASSWNCRVVRSSVRSFKDPPDGLPKRPPPCRFPPAAHEGTDAPASPTAGAIPDPGSGQRRGWEAASLCGFDIRFSGEDQLRTF